MLVHILNKWRFSLTTRTKPPLEDTVLAAVLQKARAICADSTVGLGKYYSELQKAELISALVAEMSPLLISNNPLLSIRVRLIEWMRETARYEVILSSPPGAFPGITGCLRSRVAELAQQDEDLEMDLYSVDPPPETEAGLVDVLFFLYWHRHFYMDCYQVARIHLGDYSNDGSKDWFKPCYLSCCIAAESGYRGVLGLPAEIPGPSEGARAIAHLSWHTLAQNGNSALRLEFDRAWRSIFDEPSPYEGISFDRLKSI